MGVVYRAFHPSLKRTVALKVLIAGEDASEDAIARFHREAEAVAKIGHHPNIVPVYDIGQIETGGSGHQTPTTARIHYIAMHFVEGKPLDKLIDEENIQPKHAAEIAKSVALGLQHAHEHGILHRDIKPANILMAKARADAMKNPKSQISNPKSKQARSEGEELLERATVRNGDVAINGSGEDGAVASLNTQHSTLNTADIAEYKPMITDFGLAKDVTSDQKMTRSGITLGTPAYMPPEQAKGDIARVDERSDVYSLGATLYEMLALQPPFHGDNVMELLNQVLFREPAPLRLRNPRIDRDLETICMKCLDKDPDRRYRNAAALGRDLSNYLDGAPIAARPVSAAGMLLRRIRRNKALSAVAASAFLLVLSFAVAAGLVMNSAERQRRKSEEGKAQARQRAEDEEQRRLEAEKGKAEAIGARDEAFVEIEKGRRVSALFEAAEAQLGEARKNLVRVFHSTEDMGRRQAAYDGWRPMIEDFETGVAADPASRAAWLAAKGWLLLLGGRQDDGYDLLKKAQKTDPSVVYGFLFEIMFLLMIYLDQQPMPSFAIGAALEIEPPREPTEDMKRIRKSLGPLLERAKSAGVWGKASAGDFMQAMEGFEKINEGDYAGAERGFSRALQIEEFSWMRCLLWMMRARLRFYSRNYSGGLQDIGKHLDDCPDSGHGLINKAKLLLGLAAAEARRGVDPRQRLEEAIETFDEAESVNSTIYGLALDRGLARLELASARAARGEDQTAELEAARRDFTEAARDLRIISSAFVNLGLVSLRLAQAETDRGADPGDNCRRSIDEFGEALKHDPEKTSALINRGMAYMLLGEAQTLRGGDAEASFEKALQDLGEAERRRPGNEEIQINLVGVHMKMGERLFRMGRDPIECYSKARELAEKSIGGAVNTAAAHGNFAAILVRLGERAQKFGGDPLEHYNQAVDQSTMAIELQPASAVFRLNRGLTRVAIAKALDLRREDPREALKAAVEDLSEVLRLDPSSSLGRDELVKACGALGNADRARGADSRSNMRLALASGEEAIRRAPDQAGPHFCQGELLTVMARMEAAYGGDAMAVFEKALSHMEAAYERNPALWLTLLTKSVTLDRMGRFSEASDALEKAAVKAGARHPSIEQLQAKFRILEGAPKWFRLVTHGNDLFRLGHFGLTREAMEQGLAAFYESGAPSDAQTGRILRGAHVSLAACLSQLSAGRKGVSAGTAAVPEEESAGLKAGAVSNLRKAMELGWNNLKPISNHEDFEALRELPEFQALIKEWNEKLNK